MQDMSKQEATRLADFHNPWRTSLENCMAGDNYLRPSEYAELINELDELAKYRCGQHTSLQDAYANGRDDQLEESSERIAALEAALKVAGEALQGWRSVDVHSALTEDEADAIKAKDDAALRAIEEVRRG